MKHEGILDTDFNEFIRRINEFNSKNNVKFTQTHIDKGKFYAILFYEEVKEERPYGNIGALWKKKEGEEHYLSGMLNNNNIRITMEELGEMEEKVVNENEVARFGKINNLNVMITINHHKKENKHPDYLIYKVKDE